MPTPHATDRTSQFPGCREAAAAWAVGPGEVGVTEPANRAVAVLLPAGPQVAAGEPAEHGCTPDVRSLALQRVVDLLDAVAHAMRPAAASAGSSRPSSAKPRRRSRHESHVPHARPRGSGSHQ